MKASSIRRIERPIRKHAPKQDRWSFTLQDIPENFARYINDVDKGYMVRSGMVLAGLSTIGFGIFKWFCYTQEHRPLAKRWAVLTPSVPITLLERNKIEGTKMEVFRFALPSPSDYAGYDPISSVRVSSGQVRDFNDVSRWFTPISHPEERGIIEFAIKDADPGRMASRLLYIKPGDKMYLGRWMKEFHYKPNEHKEIGLLCTFGGSSVALQLMRVMAANNNDNTKLSLLYCCQSGAQMPFRDVFADYERKYPNKFKVGYNVLTRGGLRPDALEKNLNLGMIDHNTVMKMMPPPILQPDPTVDGDAPSKSKILVCGPLSFMAPVCGRATPIGNITYVQGPFYKYSGILKELGYERQQVYKFGVSTHLLAYHY